MFRVYQDWDSLEDPTLSGVYIYDREKYVYTGDECRWGPLKELPSIQPVLWDSDRRRDCERSSCLVKGISLLGKVSHYGMIRMLARHFAIREVESAVNRTRSLHSLYLHSSSASDLFNAPKSPATANAAKVSASSSCCPSDSSRSDLASWNSFRSILVTPRDVRIWAEDREGLASCSV